MGLTSCSACGGAVGASARFCPNCGERSPAWNSAKLFVIAVAGIFLVVCLVAIDNAREARGKPRIFVPSGRKPAAATAPPPAAAPLESTTLLYAHGEVNVRFAPGTENAIVRTLARGDSVRVGPADARGWAPLAFKERGATVWIYRRSGRLRLTPP